MTSWTLRGGQPNQHGKLHPAACRATRQVWRHSLEFQGAGMAEATAALTAQNPSLSADVHDVVAQIQAALRAFQAPRLPELSPGMTTVEMVNLAKDAGETDG